MATSRHTSATDGAEPPANCTHCPRLLDFRRNTAETHPGWHNAPVVSFGSNTARMLIVGLAPGLKGANRTGRPFTGDFAGDLLYETLIAYGFAAGTYAAEPNDGLQLVDCMITNAVRCVPPQNKPTPLEIRTCRTFLTNRIASLPNLEIIVSLGRIAHDSTLHALGLRLRDHPFAHGARHQANPGLTLYDSFHCSRYNTNTGRLTPAMFQAVFSAARDQLARS